MNISKKRYTLIELMVVCGIIALLLAIGIGVFSVATRKMSDAKCRSMIEKMKIALTSYQAKTGYYIQAATLSGFYVDAVDASQDYNFNYSGYNVPDKDMETPASLRALKDPYGFQFLYQCPGTHNRTSFDLYSRGVDGVLNSADDITNWNNN